jgi:hypothetical protein
MSASGVAARSVRLPGRVWRTWRSRLGPEGLAGALLVALSLAVAGYAPVLREDTEVRKADVEALRTQLRSTQQASPATGRGPVESLRSVLPPMDSATHDLRTVFATAARHRVDVPKGDYTLHHADDGSGLARLDLVLPIKDRYVTIKALVADLLNALPHASLGELRLERPAASSPLLEARVRLTLHYRER